MNAISLDKRLLFRLACFAIGAVGTFVLLKIFGVQRIDSWILLAAWLLVLFGVYFFGKNRMQ